MSLVLDTAIDTAAARRRWLKGLTQPSTKRLRQVGFLTALDGVGALGIAAGLALTIVPFHSGPGARGLGVALLIAGAGVRALSARASTGAGAKVAADLKATLRSSVLTTLLTRRSDVPRPIGEALAVSVDAIEALDGYVARFTPLQSAAALTPLLIVLAMGLASPVSALIIALTFIPFILGMALAGSAAERQAEQQFEALRRLSGLFVDRLRALPLILSFQAEAETTRALGDSAEALASRTLDVLKIAFLSSAVLEFFAALSVALVAVYCGFNLLHLLPFPAPETLDLRRALFVLALAPEAYLPMRRLAAAYHDRQAASAVIPDLAPVLRVARSEPRKRLQRPPAIRFEGVGLTYPGEPSPTLLDFDLSIAPGECVALMGPTGVGKSTVLNLIIGQIAPDHGEITLDGERLAPERAPLAAYAGQAPLIMPGSLRDNISMVRPDASLIEVVTAAREAGLLGLLGGLERHIDERGGGLSGGERRRLGLARAVLSQSPLLLLDEPTANLDALAEAELALVIRQAMQGRTSIIATHSISLARLADRIVHLEVHDAAG